MKSLLICTGVILLALGHARAIQAWDEKPAARAAAPAKPPVRVKAAAIGVFEVAQPAQLEAQAQQYEQYMQPKMWRELEFIRGCCDLTPEQRPLIKAAGLASAKEAAKQFVRNQQRSNQTDLGVFIRKEILPALENILTPDQMAQYQQAAAGRAASIKKAIIRSTIARLDTLLYLSREQRDKITESLTTNWQAEWEAWLSLSSYGASYFPMIPDHHLTPHLNEQQKKLWQWARKLNPNFLSSARPRQSADDEWWDGKAEETEKAKSEVSVPPAP